MEKRNRHAKNKRADETGIRRLERRAREMKPGEWSRTLKRLSNDLAAQTEPAKPISHRECEEALAWYVSDEQRGENVRELYPIVWQHLQTCSECGATYAFLVQAIAETPDRPAITATSPTPSLSFLHPSAHMPWHQQRAPQLLGGQPRVAFLFNPTHIQKLFSRAPLGTTRDASLTQTRFLLLDDQISLDSQLFDVVAWLIPSPHLPDRFHLHLMLHSPDPLKSDLQARLQWGDQEFSSYLRAGETTFEDISPPDFGHAYPDIPSPDFRLVLEPIRDERHRSG